VNKDVHALTGGPSPNAPSAPLSKLTAWRNALAITLLGCLFLGLGCFVMLGRILRARMDLFYAAIWQQLGFAVALAVILLVIVIWQRARGSTLRELGWRRPTTRLAMLLAVLLGAMYLWGCYFGAQAVLPGVDVTQFHWFRLVLAPVGIFMAVAEETMMRGFFMTELERAHVATWVQIIASGACSAAYHALQDPSPLGFVPSFALFSIHAGLYVLGNRSLTPPIIAHSLYHVFGEPYLLMMVLVTMDH
jgi:membrane protease YdiL (CAAX protease family)